ncbi:MAG: ribokinase [SAR202 cluster bacterium]|nr:ribokinase [SAR202 cluster bacterium]
MTLSTLENSITVLGALNMDLIMDLERPAKPGETVLGEKFYTAPGGKGGNQAVAAARVSKMNSVNFLGSVGNDSYGTELTDYLANENIITSNINIDKNNHSGIAIIFTDKNGENYVNAVYGANEIRNNKIIDSFNKNIKNTKILITQNEMDEKITLSCMEIAIKNNIPIILDPAPFKQSLKNEYYKMADIITPNEIEAEYMTGIEIKNIDDAKKAGNKLFDQKIKNIIITLGENGAFLVNNETEKYYPPHSVREVKASVGAGDAFTGILGASLSSGMILDEAIKIAIVGSALSTTKDGAQESMPYYSEIEEIIV